MRLCGTTIVCICAWVLSAPHAAAELNLVVDGKSDFSIVIPEDPNPAETFAAEQLAHYIHRMSGATLPVRRDGEEVENAAIFVGETTSTNALELTPELRFPQDDSYRIAVRNGGLHVVGACPRGTVFAVYDLLEQLGCRWFAPNYRFYQGLHESVPEKRSLKIDDEIDLVERPDFEFRQEFCEHFYLHEPDDVVGLVDWCAKNRINTLTVRLNEFSAAWYRVLAPECARRGLLLTVEAHAFDRFLSRSRYFHDHPEWYGTVDGEPSDRYFDQFRLTHPEAVEEFKRNLREFVQSFPDLYSISAMPNDSPRWTDEDLAEHSPVELLFRSYDLIAETVYEANPEMKVSIGVGVTYFGQDGTQIWDSPYPNVTWHTAVLRRSQKYAWNDPASPLNFEQYEKAKLVTKKLLADGQDVVWSSRYAPFRDICLPVIHPRQMADELRDLHRMGGSGVNFNYAIPPAWIPYELKHHLFSRLSWDVSQDPLAILDAYYRDRFSGSPEQMKDFYDNLRSAMERYEHPGGGYTREDAFGLYPAEHFDDAFRELDTAQEAIDEAMKLNPHPEQKQVIWLLDASLQFARAKLEIDQLDQDGNTAAASARAAALMDYLETWEGKGIVYDSSFLRMRLERRFLGPPRDAPMKKVPVDNLRVYGYQDYDPNVGEPIPQPEAPFALPEQRPGN